MSTFWKYTKRIVLSTLLIATVLIAFNWEKVNRLYSKLTRHPTQLDSF
jgi:hypothetical protein